MKQTNRYQWRLPAVVIAAISMLTACTVTDNPTGYDPVISEDEMFTERLVPVADPQGNAIGTVMLRFYNDMPSVAYVSISRFQSMMYPGTTVQVEKMSANQYLLTSPCGTATVDTATDTFRSDDYEAFTNMMGMVQPGMPNTTYDALPMLRWKSLEVTPRQVSVALDYGQYGIDLRADGTDVYFPFATVSDLYTDGYMHLAAYNGQSVMMAPNGAYSLDAGYPKGFITPILQETRTADMADFSYRNLCFTLTNFFGYPGRTLLEASMREKGLDQALQDYGLAGTTTRELLQSTDMYDYMGGMATLGFLLDDGGHTYTDVTRISNISGNADFKAKADDVIMHKKLAFFDYCPEYQKYLDDSKSIRQIKKQLDSCRKEQFGQGVNYYKHGNTAYCLFNSFMCEYAGWEAFYRGEGPKPTIADTPDDWLLILIDALEKAENDPEVKNFVLDITTNGGGSSDIVAFITSLFCNKADLYYENVLTGQRMKCSYEVDRNLDGRFDEKDSETQYHLNFALLVSPYSFSCGNLLPSLLKDYGIPLIGQQTGGGSCCVLFNPTAEGFGYRYSSHRARMINLQGQNIDQGITPHYTLDTIDDFFNVSKVEQFINEYYR